MTDIRSMTEEELEKELAAMGEKKFRAAQIFEWLHRHRAESFEQMSSLPAALRGRLAESFSLVTLRPVRILTSQTDGTKKFLFELPDGNVIESVWMRYRHGNSVCISSQVGCRMGCRFCASTLDGLVRGLTASEMLEQVYRIGSLTGERVDSIVVMGSGEPLDNYDALVRFIRLATNPKGQDISNRGITVSTCGLVPEIYRLADEGLGITLALSLHASDDETRRRLMPIARKYDLAEILAACKAYFHKTGRRISYEYSLVHGVNDTRKEAQALGRLLSGQNCHVNLIPVNPIKERDFTRSGREQIEAFQKTLEGCGINATIRREMGRDIDGACGQLRRSYLKKEAEERKTL
ncbi:MAG: 23S rRNA (adenine(2503)-C(2))-methyltransferase RlmN [Lachnospiraceae bacterium]|nr:23S rRNA (adenine(2503)-C(2))-methyltransferase RlmN [Lachnospiraceae bacterium]